jgi:hypothetical protein
VTKDKCALNFIPVETLAVMSKFLSGYGDNTRRACSSKENETSSSKEKVCRKTNCRKYYPKQCLLVNISFYKPVDGRTTSSEIFNIINHFLEENEINWENCIGLCTDGGYNLLILRTKTENASHTHAHTHRVKKEGAIFEKPKTITESSATRVHFIVSVKLLFNTGT